MNRFKVFGILALAVQIASPGAQASSDPRLEVGIHCVNPRGFDLKITPYDQSGRRVEIELINKRTGQLIDDNLSYLTGQLKSRSEQVLLIEDIPGETRIEIWNTHQSNLGKIRAVYQNAYVSVDETFTDCDIIN